MRIPVLADNDAFTWAGPSQPVDLVVLCGDVYDPVILSAAKACSATQTVAVKGNHDLPSAFPPPITDLHLQVVTLPNGLRVGGFNGSWKAALPEEGCSMDRDAVGELYAVKGTDQQLNLPGVK